MTTAEKARVGVALRLLLAVSAAVAQVGQELSSYERLEDGEEHAVSLKELIRRGEAAFRAEWTPQQGGGRPFSKGVGTPLSDLALTRWTFLQRGYMAQAGSSA